MYVWNEAPGENGAPADYIYLTGFPAWDNTYAEGTLIIAGRDSLAIWRDFEPGNLPDEVIRNQLGTLEISDLKGVAYDGTYLAVSEPQSDTVAVFEGIPSAGDEPLRSYSVRGPGRLDMRDGVLAIAPKEGSEVFVVDVTTTSSPQALQVRVNLPNQAKFLPFGFGIADTSFHRVQIWNSLDDAIAGAEPAQILGNGMYVVGLMVLYLPGLLLLSKAAIVAALFNHVYIWVHYYCTERPDMLEIYGDTP
jgi:hypothetical protein